MDKTIKYISAKDNLKKIIINSISEDLKINPEIQSNIGVIKPNSFILESISNLNITIGNKYDIGKKNRASVCIRAYIRWITNINEIKEYEIKEYDDEALILLPSSVKNFCIGALPEYLLREYDKYGYMNNIVKEGDNYVWKN